MLDNFSFTLYEFLGYLLPGGVSLLGFILIYWAMFVPTVPLGVSTFEPGLVTWTAVIFASYFLGHAAQAIGNLTFQGLERAAIEASVPALRERARHAAAK